MAAFDKVKAGDSLYVSMGYGTYRSTTVDRVTDTLVICGSEKFLKSNGRRTPRSGKFDFCCLVMPTPSLTAEINEKNLRRWLQSIDMIRASEQWTVPQIQGLKDYIAKVEVDRG